MNADSTFNFLTVPGSPQEVIRSHSRSFHLASLLLPKAKRQLVAKLYAWCRWCDDAVDRAPSLDIARQRLAMLRQDVNRIEQGDQPILACSFWLADVKREIDLPTSYCLDLLDGMEMDSNKIPIHSTKDLDLYCYRAAGSVGLMLCKILSANDARSNKHAKALGMAMQLTNIARDVGEDWRMGRCYVPSSWWSDNQQTFDHEGAKTNTKTLLVKAEQRYLVGLAGMKYLPWQVRFSIRTAANLYREVGSEIAKNDFDSVSQRAFLSRQRKCFVIARSIKDEIVFSANQIVRSVLNKFSFTIPLIGDPSMNNESRYIVSLGLSLTLVTATALFAIVGLNPKDASYQTLPWLYAIVSAVSAAGFGFLAKRFEQKIGRSESQLQPAEVKVEQNHGDR